MSDVVFGIPPEVLLTRASECPVLSDLYFLLIIPELSEREHPKVCVNLQTDVR